MPVDLPPKKEVATALLQQSTVFIHLDPRAEDVIVPPWFKKQPRLVLQVGLNMPVPIPDLRLDDEGVSCTLSFNRSPCFCRIPWKAVFALISEDRRGMVWPDDVPREVAVQVQGPARQELDRARAAKRAHLRSVPTGPDAAASDEQAQATPRSEAAAQTEHGPAGDSTQPTEGADRAPPPAEAAAAPKQQRPAARKKPAKKAAKKPAAPAKQKPAVKKKPAASKKKPAASKKKAAKKPAAAKSERPKAQRASGGKKKAPARVLEVAPSPGRSKPTRSRKEAARPGEPRTDGSAADGKAGKRKLPPYLRVVK